VDACASRFEKKKNADIHLFFSSMITPMRTRRELFV
jgi:hypothetical protein